jgi:membrane protease YdiL (CAAX protease family)
VLIRELAILALTAVLLWLVRRGERLPLSSIGIRTGRIVKSLAWGVGLAIACFAAVVACLALYSALGVHYGEGSSIARSLPVTFLAVTRAGISEEIFYRGYAIERLQSLTGSKWLAAAISLAAFAGFHFRQGVAGIVLAAVLGAIITGFYLWKRDLVAAIFGHFLVDFIPNVLLPALGGGN